MSKCQEIEPLLAAYVDGEVAPLERTSVHDHIERCPPCRTRVTGEGVARSVVIARRAALRGSASEQLHARCAAVCRPQEAPRARWTPSSFVQRAWKPLAVAAAVVVAVASVLFVGLSDSVEGLAAQLALDHMKCFQVGAGTASIAAPMDAAAAGQQWAATHGWSLDVPSTAPAVQLQLRSVRRCLTTDGKVAHLMYSWKGAPLSVFVLPHVIRGASDVHQIVERLGREAVVWSRRGRTYVVLADGHPADLSPVLTYVQANAR
jgi:anti-sigma factor RsiW